MAKVRHGLTLLLFHSVKMTWPDSSWWAEHLPGLVPIRFGARTVDPVTGMLAPVIGARLDVWKRTVVPVTVSQCLTVGDTTDSVLVSRFG